jgi:hypothetical protein
MIVHAQRFVKKMKRVTPFIREHHPTWRFISDENLNDVLAWYWNRSFMAIIEDRLEVRGICLIRIMKELKDFIDPYASDKNGDFIWVELLIATDPMAIANLFKLLVFRWGKRKTILWDRGKRTQEGTPRIYRWDQYEKLTSRLTHGLSKETNYGTAKTA